MDAAPEAKTASDSNSVVATHAAGGDATVPPGILSIPAELLFEISSYLGQKERCRLLRTCWHMYNSLLLELYDHDAEDDHHALWWACYRNKVPTLETVLSHNPALVNWHFTERHHHIGASPLSMAVSRGHSKVVKRLIARHADVGVPNLDATGFEQEMAGWYPINAAIKIGDLAKLERMLKILIKHGADINQKPVGQVNEVGHRLPPFVVDAPINYLLQGVPFPSTAPYQHPGADHIQYRDELCQSLKRQLSLLEILLRFGANPNLCGDIGLPPLMQCLFILLNFEPKFTFDPRYAILSEKEEQRDIVHESLMDHIKLLVHHGADVNSIAGGTMRGQSPLHLACRLPDGHDEIVRYLVQQGSNVNAVDNDGMTPFYHYCDNPPSTCSTFKWLIKNGANVNHRDNHGRTPLHQLCLYDKTWRYRPVDRVKYATILVQNGADFEIRDNDGKTAEDKAEHLILNKSTKEFLTRARKRREREKQAAENGGHQNKSSPHTKKNAKNEEQPASSQTHVKPDVKQIEGRAISKQRQVSGSTHGKGGYSTRTNAPHNNRGTIGQNNNSNKGRTQHAIDGTARKSTTTQQPQPQSRNSDTKQNVNGSNTRKWNRGPNLQQGKNTQQKASRAAQAQVQGLPNSVGSPQAPKGDQQTNVDNKAQQGRKKGWRHGRRSYREHKGDGQMKENKNENKAEATPVPTLIQL